MLIKDLKIKLLETRRLTLYDDNNYDFLSDLYPTQRV